MVKVIQTADLDQRALSALPHNHKEWIYNGLDCCVTLEVLHATKSQLDKVSRGTYEFSKALQGPVMDMQLCGLKVDNTQRQLVLSEYQNLIRRLEKNLDRIVLEGIGVELNWRSPKQLAELLYDIIQVPEVKKRNAQGRYARTVNRDALEKLTNYLYAEPICNHILALRDLDKKRQFLETGIDADGRMRCNFNISGTKTGRLASSMSDYSTGTNLQNVDKELRSVFIADPGHKFCNIDLEQADSRNLGAICWNLLVESHGPEFAGKYLDACESEDLHVAVCKMVYDEVKWTGDYKQDRALADQIFYRDMSYRDTTKRLGHGSNYEGQPKTMSKHTKIPESNIKVFQKNYFNEFACIPEYHKWVRKQLLSFGNITTLLGRRRYFFGRAKDPRTIREAVAYSPQSMTADQVDQGMLNIWQNKAVQVLVQVHDSILFQYPEAMEDEIVPWAVEQMTINIPLLKDRMFAVPVEAKTGWNWGDYDKRDPKKNPGGLKDYDGTDTRDRPALIERKRLSIRDV